METFHNFILILFFLKDDYVVSHERKKKLAEYDKFLHKFEYKAALDSAIKTNNPSIILAMFEELNVQGGLVAALSGRDEEAIIPVLRAITKNITTPRFTQFFIYVAEIILGKQLCKKKTV